MDKPTESPTVVGGEKPSTSFAEAAIRAAIDRLQNHQRSREIAIALTHLETALLWLQKARYDEMAATLISRSEERAALWAILGMVDTLADAEINDTEFRKRVREHVQGRFEIWRPDEVR